MADYLPLLVVDIAERIDPETGDIRKTAVCKTVQPETVNLNLGKLDVERLNRIVSNKGSILMVPVRRGEFNGRAYTTIADGNIFRDSDVRSTFELTYSDTKSAAEILDDSDIKFESDTNLTLASKLGANKSSNPLPSIKPSNAVS